MPVPVAARSKVCGRSPAEVVGSNPTEGMERVVFFVVRQRSLRRANHSSCGESCVI